MLTNIKCMTLALVAALAVHASPSSASVVMPRAATAQLDALSLVWQANVICEKRREGTKTVTYSCPDRNTCVNVSGVWKCKPPGPAPMSCAACARIQKRDSDACMTSNNLLARSQCVNRVNSEYLKCIPGCTSP